MPELSLGSRIKKARRKKQLTLRDLAKKAGLSNAFLSQLERDIVSPSVNSLRKIGAALGTKVGSFFEDEEKKDFLLIRKDGRKRFSWEDSKGHCQVLASGMLNIQMEPLLITLAPGGETGERVNLHEGEEFGIVLKGEVQLLLDDKEYTMREGDSVYYRSSNSHKIVNIGKTKADILWVIFTASS
ncbi:MAG: cupin domain-containing protein [bacterium]